MSIPTREGEPIKGICYIHSETGTEGGLLSVFADTPAEGYWERLHYIERGDYLTVYSLRRPGRVLWSGVVDSPTRYFKSFDYNGLDDLPGPAGVRRETWVNYFVKKHPASLVKTEKVVQLKPEPISHDDDENRERQIETFHVDTIPVDPFDETYVLYQALSTLGYSVEFGPEKEEPNFSGKWQEVTADSEENVMKIRRIRYLIGIDGISQILDDITYGRVHRLAKLLKGQEDDYYRYSPQSSEGANPAGRYQATTEILKRYFMRAYLRYPQLVAAGNMYFEKQGDKYGPFTATPDEVDNNLYEVYTKENIEPITSGELIEMTKKVASDILTKLPWYRPG